MERWPWAVRALLGCCCASAAISLTYWIPPLRQFPLLLAFTLVVLTCWYLGMWGGVLCGLTAAVLAHRFLVNQFHFPIGFAREEVSLAVFLLVSILLGWAIRRLALQRSQLVTQELQKRLILADSERHLAEQRAQASETLRERDDVLKIALRANQMALWAWDTDRKLHCSDEMFPMYGLTRGPEDPTIEQWLQVVHPADLPAIREQIRASRDNDSEFHLQYRVIWPDGSLHWIETRGIFQRDAHGAPTRIVGVSADITSRRRSEEAMLQAEKLAVAGRLAASVAHEINNPLEAVANLLYIIAHSESLDSARSYAHQAIDELMRVSLITQQTLKFHRQTGKPRMTALSEVVETILTLFRGRLRSAQINVDLQIRREQPVPCMPGEMQQIFANLVSNAIDAMPQGGRLLIRLRPSCDWRDHRVPGMRVTFADSGTGMSRTTLNRIFEPFFTTKPETGTGLGMWVVAELVDRQGGQISIWSTQRAHSSATAISIFFPLSPPPRPAGQMPGPPEARA